MAVSHIARRFVLAGFCLSLLLLYALLARQPAAAQPSQPSSQSRHSISVRSILQTPLLLLDSLSGKALSGGSFQVTLTYQSRTGTPVCLAGLPSHPLINVMFIQDCGAGPNFTAAVALDVALPAGSYSVVFRALSGQVVQAEAALQVQSLGRATETPTRTAPQPTPQPSNTPVPPAAPPPTFTSTPLLSMKYDQK